MISINEFIIQIKTLARITKCSEDLELICGSINKIDELMSNVSTRLSTVVPVTDATCGAALKVKVNMDKFFRELHALRTESVLANRQIKHLASRPLEHFSVFCTDTTCCHQTMDALEALVAEMQVHVVGMQRMTSIAYADLLRVEAAFVAVQSRR